MLTAKARAKYFREWGRVRRACPGSDESFRHELHRRALGADKSSKAFTNADLTEVLKAFAAITDPSDLDGQVRSRFNLDAQLRHRIATNLAGQLAAIFADATRADDYIIAIMVDRFGTDDLFHIDTSQLRQLRDTLVARIKSLRK